MCRFSSGDSGAKITDAGKRLADTNHDGTVTDDDVTLVLRLIAKLISAFLMLAGRLELYPMLVLLYPALWKKT